VAVQFKQWVEEVRAGRQAEAPRDRRL
jgi:hypothetical protein